MIQYGQDVIEAWDEAKRLRCEWHDAYEKSALKSPSIQLADLEVQELNFQGVYTTVAPPARFGVSVSDFDWNAMA